MTRAVKVTASDDYSILVTLEDGRVIQMDMAFIRQQSGPVVEPLKKLEEFKKVFIRNGVVTWPTGYDIDPYFLIESGSVKNKTA
jgi:hypothetical protein